MFHVERGGMVELWGRQFEKYHFSPTCYRGVSVSRETWWVVGFYLVAVFHVERGQCLKLIQCD